MAVEVTATDYPMFIDGAPATSASGRWIEVRSPATRELVGRVPDGTGGRRGPGRRGGPGRVPRRPLVPDGAPRAGRDHEPAGRPPRPRCRRAGAARDAPDRDGLQAPARVRLRVRQRQPALLRDADPQPRGQGRLRVHRHATRASSGASRSASSARSARGTTRCGWRSGRSGRRWRPGTRSCSSRRRRRR